MISERPETLGTGSIDGEPSGLKLALALLFNIGLIAGIVWLVLINW